MSATPDWKLDPSTNEYYYFSNQENAYVYTSGRRVHVAHQPIPSGLNASSPPLPPPKPSGRNSSGISTPLAGPPRPPPHPNAARQDGGQGGTADLASMNAAMAQIPPPEAGWLPEILKDKKFVVKIHMYILQGLTSFQHNRPPQSSLRPNSPTRPRPLHYNRPSQPKNIHLKPSDHPLQQPLPRHPALRPRITASCRPLTHTNPSASSFRSRTPILRETVRTGRGVARLFPTRAVPAASCCSE
jgi:hypothetical protein